ncbi:MAG TPA: RNA pseudouridine synthase [Bacteroidales bacterium]|nr:RNA pseudouridine synthase [Bacteroidales bacterium]
MARFIHLSQRILYEDNHLLVINKLPGEIVQGDKTGDKPLVETAKDYIAQKYHKPGEVFLGVVHRLDRPVSGAIILARTSKALERLNAMLQERKIQKTYWAIVKNKPPKDSDTLVNYIRRNELKNKTIVLDHPTNNSSEASLTYRVLAQSFNYYLLEIELHTGRHHQIRAQLAHIGCPIKGDLKYGFPRSNEGAFIHLHSLKISLIHPVKAIPLELIAPPPHDTLWNYFFELFYPKLFDKTL